MGQVFKNRVRDTTTTTGTGTVTLSGTAPSGFQTFANAMAVGDNCYYLIAGGTEWEVGYGTLVTSTTLSRARVLESTNSGALVNFSAGTKDVIVNFPASLAQNRGTIWALTNGYALQ